MTSRFCGNEAVFLIDRFLYAEFGSKTGLFEAAVDQYEQFLVPSYIGRLEQPTASLETCGTSYAASQGFPRTGSSCRAA